MGWLSNLLGNAGRRKPVPKAVRSNVVVLKTTAEKVQEIAEEVDREMMELLEPEPEIATTVTVSTGGLTPEQRERLDRLTMTLRSASGDVTKVSARWCPDSQMVVGGPVPWDMAVTFWSIEDQFGTVLGFGREESRGLYEGDGFEVPTEKIETRPGRRPPWQRNR